MENNGSIKLFKSGLLVFLYLPHFSRKGKLKVHFFKLKQNFLEVFLSFFWKRLREKFEPKICPVFSYFRKINLKFPGFSLFFPDFFGVFSKNWHFRMTHPEMCRLYYIVNSQWPVILVYTHGMSFMILTLVQLFWLIVLNFL